MNNKIYYHKLIHISMFKKPKSLLAILKKGPRYLLTFFYVLSTYTRTVHCTVYIYIYIYYSWARENCLTLRQATT